MPHSATHYSITVRAHFRNSTFYLTPGELLSHFRNSNSITVQSELVVQFRNSPFYLTSGELLSHFCYSPFYHSPVRASGLVPQLTLLPHARKLLLHFRSSPSITVQSELVAKFRNSPFYRSPVRVVLFFSCSSAIPSVSHYSCQASTYYCHSTALHRTSVADS